ncbi:MAG: aldo/keto reductase [Aggregatilineales bacterium]
MRYKLLGKSGLRVSELCLGTMTFGEDWGWGASKEVSQKIFDAFVAQGGNFVDTANNYTNGTSETYVGEFIKSERDHFVLATKYTLTENPKNPNAGGNSRKNMVQTIEKSLRRLDTEAIDVLYLHMWDIMTPVAEVLRSVDDLIRAGKVHYFAFSDTPAWVVSYAVALAETHGWSRPVAIQVPYSLAGRAAERDIFPMARELDLSVTPWGVIGQGALTGKYNTPNDDPKRDSDASPKEKNLAEVLMKLGAEIGQTPAQIAINYVRAQMGNIIPIIGARTEKQIVDNLGALEFSLTPEQVKQLNDATDFKIDFPLSFLTNDHVRGLIFGETFSQIDNHRVPVTPV